MKKLDSRLVNNLLDDQPDLKVSALDWNPKTLTPAPPRPMAPKTTAPQAAKSSTVNTLRSRTAQAAKAAATKAAPKTAAGKPQENTKIIRSSQTLKQMMAEYNRPRPSAVFKTSPRSARSGVRFAGREFESDSVEHITLSEIPGRILRPS